MDWNKLKQEYISGGISYRKLAEKYGVSESTLSKRAMVEKWAELKAAAEQEGNEEIIKVVGKKQGKRIEKLQSVADKMLKKIEMIVDELSAQELMPALKTLTGALKDIKDVQKSGTDVKEQLARINKLERDVEVPAPRDYSSEYQALADMINNPQPNRNIHNFEVEDE